MCKHNYRQKRKVHLKKKKRLKIIDIRQEYLILYKCVQTNDY